MAWFSRGEGDALRVQEVQQLGSAQTDARCLELGLELRQREWLVLQHATIQHRVGLDKGTHSLEFVLLAQDRLGCRDPLAV